METKRSTTAVSGGLTRSKISLAFQPKVYSVGEDITHATSSQTHGVGWHGTTDFRTLLGNSLF